MMNGNEIVNKGDFEMNMNNLMDKKGMMNDEMDEEERKIRAELFLL